MSKFSRTAKYEDLRNDLQNDVDEKAIPNDLSYFANRLNKIDEEEFQEIAEKPKATEPERVRPNIWKDDFFEEEEDLFGEDYQELEARVDLAQEKKRAMENTQKMATFDNEYLDEYLLDEVKSYNREQGITTEDQLQSKLLSEIRGEKPVQVRERVAHEKSEKALLETATLQRWGDAEDEVSFQEPPRAQRGQSQVEEYATYRQQEVISPFGYTNEKIQPETKNNQRYFDETTMLTGTPEYSKSSEFESDFSQFVAQQSVEQPQTQYVASPFEESYPSSKQSKQLERQLVQERTERETLLRETTQIKMELDEYKGNLTEMEEKFDNSNRMLNFILIIFILICLVVVGVAVYWILLNRGLI
ncbi:MAG: hypothetical protein ACK5LZ_05720 [Anaerorhabdus sp.]